MFSPLLLFLALFFSSCVEVQAGKIKLMDAPLLATFFPEPSYSGFPFRIHAFYDSCYNFHGLVESITLGKVTEYCDVYTVSDCGEDDPFAPYRPITGPTPRVMDGDEGEADGLRLGAVRSVRCYLDEDMVQETKGELK